MGIYKVKGKKGESWGIDFYDNGQRIKKIIGSKQDAEHSLHLIKADSLRGELRLIKKSDMSFKQLTEKYLEYGKTNGKRSLRRDQFNVKALIDYFEYFKASQINPLHIEGYKRKRLEEGRKPGTINRELACLKHMFNLAIKWKLARENPVREVKLLKAEKYEMQILDRIEIDLLVKAAEERLKPILIVALNTGMRRGEVMGLRWSDIDFVNYNMHIKNTKSGKDRIVPMNSLVAGTLKKQDMSGEFVFLHLWESDRSLKNVSQSLRLACKKIGIEKFRFHDLRHNAATLMVQAGVDLVTVKEILGHSNIQTTMIYCHSSQELKRKAVIVLEKALSSPGMMKTWEENGKKSGAFSGE